LILRQDDFKNQAATAQKQLKEAVDAQGKGDSRLTSAMQTIRSLQDERSKLSAKLSQKDVSIAAQVSLIFYCWLFDLFLQCIY
jgi:hypothetical protein